LPWTGGDQPGARVLAVNGNLSLTNVSITGGSSVAEAITVTTPYPQPWTLARGGALAVWGTARLVNCTLYDNHVSGDFDASRDRGAFGGAVYADLVDMQGCVVSGNSVLGGGAAGGGVYSVGGAGHVGTVSTIDQSTISGNRISGLFTYGAGVYSDGGSIGNQNRLELINSTIARNLVEPAPGLPGFVLASGYWRGGGVYMSNGYLEIQNCTIVENEVRGVPRTDSLGRRNLAGGIAATVGNAHAVEDLIIGNSIVAGNTVQEVGGNRYAQDIYSGSLFYFRSAGYNRIGVLDFSSILVPVGQPGWASLSRKHYPQPVDADGVAPDRRHRHDWRGSPDRTPSFRLAPTRESWPCCITRRRAVPSGRSRHRPGKSKRHTANTLSPVVPRMTSLRSCSVGWRIATRCPASPPPFRPISKRSCSQSTRIPLHLVCSPIPIPQVFPS
jgi:hypothetical protein